MPETHPDPEVAARLSAAFAAEETTLRAALDRARADFEHRGVRGDAVERAVRHFLSRHLPRKYTVGTGETIDRLGHRSNQLDVLVLNDEQPFVQEPDTSGLYLIEGVAAVGEIKTSLGSSELDDILSKGQRLRQIQPTIPAGSEVRGLISDIHRFVDSVPYFALALGSSLASETILQKLMDAPDITSWNGTTVPALDALFVLDRGAYLNFGDGEGALQFRLPDGSAGTGWFGPFPDGALVALFNWLNGSISRVRYGSSIASPYLMATNVPPDNEDPPAAL
ncbi:hypothetical protein RN51_00444 [Microbacterium oxydans]|uniref:DUF6602 domain-containing protein n=1 Tax=Microbacterium oxydans TaxID=82380 RepID=A0A0F0KYF4_9MICO|nr:DUF6602 domain-containing protein [Microbacterium oxydans]KJL25937.1 hypothetical protein RN51_00444 [Microbacterium oxydans]